MSLEESIKEQVDRIAAAIDKIEIFVAVCREIPISYESGPFSTLDAAEKACCAALHSGAFYARVVITRNGVKL